MALTIYEGIKDNQLVDEDIDEVILRLLGLEDINDLDYDTYKTLLKERMMAGRMSNNTIPSQETEKLTEEYKRVKRETGRFKVKKKPIKKDSFTPPDVSRGTRTRRSGKRLDGNEPSQKFLPTRSKADEVEDTISEKQESSMEVMDFLTRIVAPSLAKIEASLANILASQTSEQKAQKKAAESARKGTEKAKSRDKEEGFESAIVKKLGDGAKAIAKPFSGIFDAIWKFVKNIVLGIGALKLIEFFQDPSKIFRDIGNMMIGSFNDILKGVFYIIYSPLNLFVNMLNGILNEFEYSINETIGKVPGVPELKLPDIPNFEAPQIPKIPEPEKPESTPVPGMAGGGEVTNVTNKYYQLMESGGKVGTNSGEKVTGAGPDTQLVALQPGEVVMSKGAVDAYGADTLLGMNAAAGGTNSPKMARVQSASGGGLIPAMQGGGYVGTSNVVDTGYQDYKGRPVMMSPPASAAFKQMVSAGMPYNPADIANVYRDKSEYNRLKRQGYNPASNSHHNHGEAADIHGAMNAWIRKNGAKYGWKANDYSGSHGGHFEYKGGGGGRTQVDPQETVTGRSREMVSGSSPKGYNSNLMPSSAASGLLSKMGVESQDWKIYKDTLASIETSGMSLDKAYSTSGGSGGAYDGRYQMGAMAKADAARILGIPVPSREEFRNNPQLQEDMILAYTYANNGYMLGHNVESYNSAGSRERLSYLGFAHNQGHAHAANWLLSNKTKDPTRDGFGTSGTKFTKALKRSFGTGSSERSAPGQSPTSTSPSGRPNLPQSAVHERNFNFTDVTIPDAPSSQRPRIRPPLTGGSGGGGGSSVVVPSSSGGGGAGSQQAPTSSSGGHQSESPMFSPIDENNPELLVVKSIYNIVG